MNRIDIFITARKLFPDRIWHWLILALKEDPVIWGELTSSNSDLAEIAFSILPPQIERWSPASLGSLRVLGKDVTLDLVQYPLQPFDSNILEKGVKAFEKWRKEPYAVEKLEDSFLIALVLRERLRLKGGWKGIEDEIGEHPQYLNTVFACLFGMIPKPIELIEYLFELSNDFVRVAFHSMFSTPKPIVEQLNMLERAIHTIPAKHWIRILAVLESVRPWLVQDVANWLVQTDQMQNEDEDDTHIEQIISVYTDSFPTFVEFTKLLRDIEIHKSTGDYDEVRELIVSAIETVKKIEGFLLSHNASILNSQAIEKQEKYEGLLSLWKNASQLNPNEPKYAIGIANALLELERFEDAQAYLAVSRSNPAIGDNAELLLLDAFIAFKLLDISSARQIVNDLLPLLSSNARVLSSESYEKLVDLLLELNEIDKAIAVIEKAGNEYAFDLTIKVLYIELLIRMKNYWKAAENAYFATVLARIERLRTYEEISENEIHEKLILSLEGIKEWRAALDEYVHLNEQRGEFRPKDFHALAAIAIQADEIKQAIQFCNQAINIKKSDGIAYGLLGKAYLDSGDLEDALDKFQQATHLIPSEPLFWIYLADTYSELDNYSKFFETLRAATHIIPDSPEIHYEMGRAFLTQNAPTQALNSLRKAFVLISRNFKENEGYFGFKYDDDLIGLKDKVGLGLQVATLLGKSLRQLGFVEESADVLGEMYVWVLENGAEQFIKDGLFLDLTLQYGKTLVAKNSTFDAIDVLDFYIRFKSNDYSTRLLLIKEILALDDLVLIRDRAYPLLSEIIISNELDGFPKESSEEESSLSELEKAEAVGYYAEILRKIGDYQRSIKYYKKALETQLKENSDWNIQLSIGLGEVAIKLGEPEIAVAVLQDVIRKVPDELKPQKLLAQAYLAAGLIEDSYKASKMVVEIEPGNPEVLVWYAKTCLRLSKESKLKKGFFKQEAIATLERAIEIWPNRYDLIIELAGLQKSAGENESALRLLKSVINDDADIEKIQIDDIEKVALLLEQLGEPDLAIYILGKTLRIFDTSPQSEIISSKEELELKLRLYKMLSNIQQEQGYLDAALETIDMALELSVENVEFYLEKAKILESAGRNAEALTWLQDTIQKFPASPDVHRILANIFYSNGDFYNAINHIEFSLGAARETVDNSDYIKLVIFASRLARGMLLFKKALSFLDTVNKDRLPDDFKTVVYGLRAELLMDIGEWGQAELYLGKIEQIERKDPYSIAMKSRSLWHKGKMDESRVFLEEATGILDNIIGNGFSVRNDISQLSDVEILRVVGESALQVGNWRRAGQLLASVYELSPRELLSNFDFIKVYVLLLVIEKFYSNLDIAKRLSWVSNFCHKHKENSVNISNYLEDSLLKISNQNSDRDEIQVISNLFQDVTAWNLSLRTLLEPTEEAHNSLWNHIENNGGNLESIIAEESAGVEEKLNRLLEKQHSSTYVAMQLAMYYEKNNIEKAFDLAISVKVTSKNNEIDRFVEKPMLAYLLARLAYKNQAYAMAYESINDAIIAWDDEPNWLTLASEIYRVEDETIGLPKVAKALALLERAVKLDPSNVERKIEFVELLIEENELNKASQMLERLIHDARENPRVWMLLAEVHERNGKFDDAITSAAYALDKSEDPIPALLLRARIELRAGNFAGTEGLAKTIIKLEPNNIDAFKLLVHALEKQNRFDEAIKNLSKYKLKFDNLLWADLEHVRLLKLSRGTETAISVLRNLAKQNPNTAKFQVLLSLYLVELGKIKDAEVIANKLMQERANELENEDLSVLYYVLANKMIVVGQLDQAIDKLTKAIQSYPYNLTAYLKLAEVYANRREGRRALELYSEIIATFPEDYRAYYQAGYLLKELKDYQGAEKMLKHAANLAPENIAIRNLLNAIEAINIVNNKLD